VIHTANIRNVQNLISEAQLLQGSTELDVTGVIVSTSGMEVVNECSRNFAKSYRRGNSEKLIRFRRRHGSVN